MKILFIYNHQDSAPYFENLIAPIKKDCDEIKQIAFNSLATNTDGLSNFDYYFFDFISDDNFLEKVKEFSSLNIFLMLNSHSIGDKARSNLARLTADEIKVLGIIDLSLPAKLNKFHLDKIVDQSQKAYSQESFFDISNYLQKMITASLDKLAAVKEIHEKFVPLREHKIKGLKIYSKFVSGSLNGGEFFDIYNTGQGKVLIHSIFTNSYVLSSRIISEYDDFKVRSNFSDSSIDDYFMKLTTIMQERREDDSECEDDLKIFMAYIDLNQLFIKGRKIGEFSMFDQNKIFIDYAGREFLSMDDESEHFDFHLSRGHSFIITSPGIFKNCNGHIEGKNIVSFVQNIIKRNPVEIFNEVFYSLFKGRDSKFLDYDSSLIYIKVDKNAIIQV